MKANNKPAMTFERFYRMMTGLLIALIIGWFIALGTIEMGPSTVFTGSIILVGLMVTLFVAGRKDLKKNNPRNSLEP